MEEIEVGEYVRTKDGKIGKFVKYSSRSDSSYYKSPFDCFIKLQNRKTCLQCAKDYIVKHSKNIIDLLEVGDYVNGHLLVELSENVYNQKLVTTEVDGKDGAIRHHYLERGIKSIVTKEQFSSMEYKVEEDKDENI